jgi:hypothetical protein
MSTLRHARITKFGTLTEERWLGDTAHTTTLLSLQAYWLEKAGCCVPAQCLPCSILLSVTRLAPSGFAIGFEDLSLLAAMSRLAYCAMAWTALIMFSNLSMARLILEVRPTVTRTYHMRRDPEATILPPIWIQRLSRTLLAHATLPVPIVEWIDLEAGFVSSAT